MTQDPVLGTRYSLFPLMIVALIFIAASPVCWLLSEIHTDNDVVGMDYENAVLYQVVYPFHRYAATSMQQGVLPLWNPRLHCGAPFAADFTLGIFQPLNALFLVLPTERAMAALAFVTLCLSGMFFVLFGRALGLSYTASVVGGVVFAFSGASLAASSRPELGATLAWAVLGFWGLREFKNTGHLAPMVLLGAACALMILAGGWALVLVFLVVLAAYALVLFYRGADDVPLPRFGAALVAVAAALGLSAVQWVTTLPWLLDRAEPWATFWDFNLGAQTPDTLPALIRQLLTSEAGNLPRLVYVGVGALLLAPAGLFYQGHKRDAAFFAVTVPIGFTLTIAPPSAALAGAAPLFAYPSVLALSVLASMGTHRLLSTRRGNPVWYVGIVTLIAAVGLFLLIEPLGRSTVVLCVILLAPALLFRNRWVGRIAAMALALLAFFDLTVANANNYAHPLQDAPQCYSVYGDLIGATEERALGARSLVSTHPLTKALPETIAMINTMYSAGGTHVPLTMAQAAWWRALNPSSVQPAARPSRRLLDVMAVRVLLTGQGGAIQPERFDDSEAALSEVRRQDGIRMVQNELALPRALIVPEWLHVDGVSGALEVIQRADFDPRRTATVDLQVSGLESLVRTQGAVPGAEPAITTAPNTGALPVQTAAPPDWDPASIVEAQCTIQSASPTRVVLDVATPRAGVSVLNDTHAPGWRATLNGVQVPILRVNGLFRGIATPPGRHIIVFEYRPLGFYAGAAVSLLTLVVLAALGLRMLWRVV